MKKTIFIIIGILLIAGIFSSGIYLWQKSKDWKKDKIIYADIQTDKEDPREPVIGVTFYSIKANGTEQKKLFNVEPSEAYIDPYSKINFCPSSQKIYIRTSEPIKDPPYQNLYIKEIDLEGNIRNLKFTGTNISDYKNWEYLDKNFTLSPDCQKIIWSTSYYKYENYQEIDAVNEIIISTIDGQNKKVLLTTHRNKADFIKEIGKWSSKNPTSVYLTNYDWDRGGGGGGLYKININTGFVSRIENIESNHTIWAISPSENLIAHSSNIFTSPSSFFLVTDLKSDHKYTIQNASNGKREFSPDDTKIANVDYECSGIEASAKCISNLYISDYENENKKISANTELEGWLSDNIILGKKDKSLVTINSDGSKENHITTIDDYLLFIGIIKN